MKIAVGSVFAAVAASACCLGPVVFSALGAGALSAAATGLAPYRPFFLAATAALLGTAFYTTYRRSPEACAADGACRPSSRRAARIVLWVAAVLAVLIGAFPYYVSWLL